MPLPNLYETNRQQEPVGNHRGPMQTVNAHGGQGSGRTTGAQEPVIARSGATRQSVCERCTCFQMTERLWLPRGGSCRRSRLRENAVPIFCTHYNWCVQHQTCRRSPSVSADGTDSSLTEGAVLRCCFAGAGAFFGFGGALRCSHLIRHGFAVPPSPRGEGFGAAEAAGGLAALRQSVTGGSVDGRIGIGLSAGIDNFPGGGVE